jgi:hypothetical protein
MKRTSHGDEVKFATLWEYVNAQPRTKSFADMAEECGCTPSQFSEYVWGRRKPSGAMALRIKKRVAVAIEGLLAGEPMRKPLTPYRQRMKRARKRVVS